MSVRHAPALVLASCIIALAGSAVAELVTGTFSGTVTKVDGWGGASPPGDVATGDAVLGCFRYDTAAAEPRRGWPFYRWNYLFRNRQPSQYDMHVTVRNDGEGHEQGLIDVLEVAYGGMSDSRPAQHAGSMYQPELYSNNTSDTAFLRLLLQGTEVNFLRSHELPTQPADLRLSPAVQAGGYIASYGGPLGHWRIIFEPVPLSLRIKGEPITGAAAGPSRDKAALEAERLCEDQDT